MKKFFYALLFMALAVSSTAGAFAPQKAMFTSGGVGPIAPISPDSIAGLSLWLDASDSGTVIHSGGSVSQWNDKSGNANNATQGTSGNRPTTNTRTINSLNVIDFDGTNDGMVLPSALYSIPNGQNTIFIVNFSDVTAAGSRQTLTAEPSAFNINFGIQYGPISSPNYLGFGNGQIARTVTRDTNPHIFALRKGATAQLYYDGGTPTSVTSTNSTAINMTLGYSPSYGDYWNGVFAEIIVYNFALSDAQMNGVAKYLENKWGVVWNSI